MGRNDVDVSPMTTDPRLELLNNTAEANCDTCREPGACCRSFHVGIDVPEDMSGDALKVHLRAGLRPTTGTQAFEVLPYDPDYVYCTEGKQKGTVQWCYSCPELQPDGRCGIYETRPTICRDYIVGSDALCVEWPGHADQLKTEE